LAAALSVEAAQPEVWGAAANGLRLSLSVTGEKFGVGQEIAIRLRNDGPKEVLIPLGNGNGPTHFKLRLTGKDGTARNVAYTGIGGVGEVMEPLTIGLRPGEAHTIAIPVGQYYVQEGRHKLRGFLRHRGRLSVELDVAEGQCPVSPRKLPCWLGKAVSNVIELPAGS
jgi:hypothetical protein